MYKAMTRKVIKIGVGVAVLLLVYVVAGIVLSKFVFPRPLPDLSNYFHPGDKLASRFEGFDQTILSVQDGWLNTRLEVRPHAAGPPEHFHEGFEERFRVVSGTLSILVNGEKRTLRAGEVLTIPPMTPHKPFNETDETVVVEGDDPRVLPIKFGYALSQLYGVMDRSENGPSVPVILLQLSVFGNDADTWIPGLPLGVQKVMRTVMEPTARILGYRNHYPEYGPTR